MASMATNEEANSSSSSLPRSSTGQKNYTYEVFLSFRGEDTRFNFTDHLHSLLCDRGIETFIDDELRRGEEISLALVKAIEESRVSIIVFSQNYASSRWCLDELVKILECRKSKGQEVRPIFYKVDPSDVRHQRGAFGDAFAELDQCKYKDSIAKWKAALTEAADLSGWPFKDGESEAKFIKKIIGELSVRVVNPSCKLQVAEHPIGLESCRQDVTGLLDAEENDMVGIWGPGGIGKTSIAKAVFNSIQYKFERSCFLADVRSNGLAQLQETLLSDILKEPTWKVSSVDQGVSLIKTRMRHIRVLLILDDVSHSSQLENLVPSPHCFGPGSRILITTRDEHLLRTHQVQSVYKVKMLNDAEALELFSWNAFKCRRPAEDFVELANHAVRYAQGLPLALIVIGRHLFGRRKEQWADALNSYRRVPPKTVLDILRISFDGLEEDYVKELFLDLACFFKGKHVDQVLPILIACDRNPVIGIELLKEKALITVNGCRIWMHDLIEEMGKEIVRQEGETGERSRLWNYDDVNRVLTDNIGTNKIKGIQVERQEGEMMCLNAKSFSEMKILAYFSCSEFVRYSGNIDYLSNELRWLNWSGCPIQSFPSNFQPRKLVALKIPSSPRITRLWEGLKNFPILTSLDLSHCESLTEVPNLTGIPNLKELKLDHCGSLVEVHDSIGSLDKLVTLSLEGCWNLIKFPTEISLKSLCSMNLRYCSGLEEFPKIIGKMDFLTELDISFSQVKELHPTIGNLIGLNDLYLDDCNNLTTLPFSIYGLKNLQILSVSGCSKFGTFPEIKGKMNCLKELYLRGSGITELHPSIGNLIGLNELNLGGCEALTRIPCSIYELQSLKILNVGGCSNLITFPVIMGKMNSLTELYLGGSGITELHPSIGNLIELNQLDLADCKNLTTIPCSIYELQNLEILDVSGCSNLVTIPTKACTSSPEHDNGVLALPKLREFRINRCNLSTADFIGSLDCLETLTELDLSSNNFVNVPALGKFVNLEKIGLSCCKRLLEIPELPLNVLEVNAWGCESLEGLLIMPKCWKKLEMNLWKCHRFSCNLGYDMEKMEHILVNNRDCRYSLVLPGNEVPKWFHVSKEIVANEYGQSRTCEISFEIPSKLNWENIGLAVCFVSSFSDEGTYFSAEICINAVRIDQCSNWPSPSADHMWLTYVPLCDKIKGKVDQKGWSCYQCRVQCHTFGMKSCGVHLVCQPPKEHSNNTVMAAKPAADESCNGAYDDYHHQQEQQEQPVPSKRHCTGQEQPSMPPIPDYSASASTSDQVFQTSGWQENLDLLPYSPWTLATSPATNSEFQQ